MGYLNFGNFYKILGLPMRYGRLTSKEFFFFRKMKIDNFSKRIANIDRIKDIVTIKSTRHIKNYPANGQRTRTNGKTRKIYKRV
jgi:ribosomal protein S13